MEEKAFDLFVSFFLFFQDYHYFLYKKQREKHLNMLELLSLDNLEH